MILFVNTLSKNSYLWLFDKNKEKISEIFFEIKWNESILLLPKIEEFLKENNFSYKDIKNFIVVNWPWSFTWIRTVVLAINTINFIIKESITPISFFDLFEKYPIIKSSSKRDSFIKFEKNSEIKILENEKIKDFLEKNNIYEIYWDFEAENIKILEKIDYCDIINKIELKNFKKIEALYIKKPNIC